MRVAWVALLFVGMTLAGCTANDESPEPSSETINRDSFQLQSGKGAIAGLLVDDRFRPIHLVDNPQGEFQTTGFVLVQETGQETKTNANGEFTFTNLEPGQYTLRVTAAGHEATPQRVSVTEGVFNELSVIARRVASTDSLILTQDFSAFVPCAADFIVNGVVANCVLDLSGDSFRSGFDASYTAISDATFLVVEAKMNQQASYVVQVRENDGSTAGGARYVVGSIQGGDYIKMVLERGVVNEEHNGQNNNVAWENNEENPLNTIFFMEGEYKEEFSVIPVACCGIGANFGMRAEFLHSLFIGAPEVDIESYCVLC